MANKRERQARIAELLKDENMSVEQMLEVLRGEGYSISESTYFRDKRDIEEIWIQRTAESTETRIARALQKLDRFQRLAIEADDHKAARSLLRDELEVLQLVGPKGRAHAPESLKVPEHGPGWIELCMGEGCDHTNHKFLPPPKEEEGLG